MSSAQLTAYFKSVLQGRGVGTGGSGGRGHTYTHLWLSRVEKIHGNRVSTVYD